MFGALLATLRSRGLWVGRHQGESFKHGLQMQAAIAAVRRGAHNAHPIVVGVPRRGLRQRLRQTVRAGVRAHYEL